MDFNNLRGDFLNVAKRRPDRVEGRIRSTIHSISKSILLTTLLFVTTIGVSAQGLYGPIGPYKTPTFFGDIAQIKKQKEINLEIDFSGVWVNGTTEEKWLANETKEKTAEEKANWLSEWKEILPAKAFSGFVEFFNIEMESYGMKVGKYPNAEYTMQIQVKDIYAGFFAAIFSRPTKVIADVHFLKNGDKNPVATVISQYSYIQKFYYDDTWFVNRISRSFKALGDHVGKSIIAFTPTTEKIISICNLEVMNYDFMASYERAKHDCPDGWRLPTSEELKCMCNNKKTKKNNSPLELNQTQYWTGNEAKNKENAISRTTNDCKEEVEEKMSFFSVRYVKK